MKLNKVFLFGTMSKKPVLEMTVSGKRFCRYMLRVPSYYKGKYFHEFFPIMVWENVARIVSEYGKQHARILVEGRMSSSKYEDENGKTHYSISIIGDTVSFENIVARNEKPPVEKKEEKEEIIIIKNDK